MFNRIFLFLGTNIAIMMVLSAVMKVFGLETYLHQSGQNMTSLLIFSAVFGMAGSLISLVMSKSMAKRSTGAQVIESPRDATERWLFDTVQRQAQQAGIGMPEVAIYDSADVNAFATGMNKNKALVAVSSGLLDAMTQDEAEAVLAHEVSHVANGDMVTLTLVQGVVNTFVIFFSRIIGRIVDQALSGGKGNSRGGGMGYFVSSMIAQFVLGFLASMIVAYFSRWREFRADAGAGTLSSNKKMADALRRLQSLHTQPDLPDQMAALGISGKAKRLFSTHPPLADRIAALEEGSNR